MNCKNYKPDRELIWLMVFMVPATIGSVGTPLIFLGFPFNLIFPLLLAIGIGGLVIGHALSKV